MDIYVLQVITGKENEARKLLQSIVLTSGGRIIFPRRELMQRKGGRQYKKVQPLFPGYLFWETSELDDDIIHIAVHLTHVVHFLPDNRHIRPMSREDGDLLKPFLRDDGLTPLVTVRFNENDRIVILDGPLKGQEGRIVKVDRRRWRMRVSLNLYDTGHLVDFGYKDLGINR